MEIFKAILQPDCSIEEAWESLENRGFIVLYSEEDNDGNKQIFCSLDESYRDSLISDLPSIFSSIEKTTLAMPNWEKQWEEHAHYFKDGHIELNFLQFPFSSPPKLEREYLYLNPGPGFGDLSHPTTRLVLKMMASRVHQKEVVDIGCGSGVLALSALCFGASFVYGIDIDEKALSHAESNANLNELTSCSLFGTPFTIDPRINDQRSRVICMNMIINEQIEALSSLPSLSNSQGIYLVSGVLSEQKDEYSEIVCKLGLKIVEEEEEDGWLGFVLTQK